MLNQKFIAVLGALFIFWSSLQASGALPDGKWQHIVEAVMIALQAAFNYLAFNRTAAGTVIPEAAKKVIDANAGIQMKVEHPPQI